MLKRVDKWWEGLCHNCGMCCHEKTFNDDIIFIDLESPCKYLDKCSNNCGIYKERFKINSDCSKVNLYQALFNPYLPGSCGYVKKVRIWKRRNNG